MNRIYPVAWLILSIGAVLSPISPRVCQGQITSEWLSVGTSTTWSNLDNWTSGIPILAGDVAQIPATPKFSPNIGSSNSISLGQLTFFGTGGVAVNGSGNLLFSNPGAAPAIISGPGTQTRNATIAPTILISDGELLSLEPGNNTALTFTSGFGVGSGDVALNGAGKVTLGGGVASWLGQMTINGGQLNVNAASALGSTAAGTVIQGGIVTLNAVVAEPFTLQGGVLQSSVNFLDLNGPLFLPAGNTATVRGPFDINGGTSGSGDLSIVATGNASSSVQTMPLNHQGGVKISSGLATRQFASFTIDNGYSGPTEITNVQLVVRTPNGLGSVTAGTTVGNGELRLHGGSSEGVSLTDSTLALWSAETTLNELRFAGNIKLKNSTLTTYGEFRGATNYIIEQPVQLDGGINTIATGRGGLTLAGGLVGTGKVVFNPNSSYPINVIAPIPADLEPELQGGSWRLLSQDVFHGNLFVHGGRLLVEADQHVSRVRTGTLVFPDSPSGNIEIAPGRSLTAAHVDMVQGLILGTVHTPDGFRFDGFLRGRTISHLDVDEPVKIWAGEVAIDDTVTGRAPTRTPIHIERAREASAFVGARSTTDANFYLNNGSGFNFGGALVSESDFASSPATTLRGDIYLGSHGAYIGGVDHLRIHGQIYGGDLNLGRHGGTPGLVIETTAPAYTGVSRLFAGEMIVADGGRLANTSAVELYAGARLAIDARPSDGPLSDRVADNIPIRMYGGELGSYPTEWGMNTQERVNQIYLERGMSAVHGSVKLANSLQSQVDLVVGEIIRAPGALLALNGDEPRNSNPFTLGDAGGRGFVLENRPQLVNGLLPAWLVYGQNFTSYDQNGRVAGYFGPTVDLSIADETSIASPAASGTTLTMDKTIHALSGYTAPVDLNGHTLTIGSGGVSGANLSNGVIRPGQYANGELIFIDSNSSNASIVNASIVDNGTPTSVVYAGNVVLGGINTYTGTTYVLGGLGKQIAVKNSKAIPTDGRIELAGRGDLVLRDFSANATYAFGDVVIRDAASFESGCDSCKSMSARSILMESGNLAVPLAGNFPITKQTDGTAIMWSASPGFTGQVDIVQGTLQAGGSGADGYLAFGSGTVNVQSSGRLVLGAASSSASVAVPTIRLLGGSLFGISGSSGSTSMRGTLDVVESSAIYLLDGMEDRPRSADIKIDGSIRVATGKTVTVIGRPDTSRGLEVTQGFQFGAGSILAGNGAILAQVQIGNGVVLSPGLIGDDPHVGLLATSTPISTADLQKSKMTWASDGRYRWEINDADFDAGAPFGRGWDVMRIGTILDITATATDPFIIEPVPLTEDDIPGALKGLALHRQYRWLIAEIGRRNSFSATINGFAAEKFAIDATQFNTAYPGLQGKFWLDMDSNGIYLNSMLVPEPENGIFALFIFGGTLCCQWRRSYAA